MRETELHHDACRHLHGVFTRFENTVRTGVFDANVVKAGAEHWIEYKIRDGNDIKVRGSQFSWAYPRVEAGARNMWFLVGHDKRPPELFAAALILPRCLPSRNDGRGHMLVCLAAINGIQGWTAIEKTLFSWG